VEKTLTAVTIFLQVCELPQIARHYLGTRFLLDLGAAMPLDLVMWAGSRAIAPAGQPFTPPWRSMAWREPYCDHRPKPLPARL